ncbi:hypothetical protein, partial [Mesobacillus zeae]|uniref:hypothetical protein n=1 Tax=Mesobacillus zeae TaxID=1917180 RepID=UPI0030084990
MIKLANEIIMFANSIDDNFVNEYKYKLRRQREKQKKIDRILADQREAEKNKRLIPKQGFILLIRFANGTCKFTYPTSLHVEQKIYKTKSSMEIINKLFICLR